MPADEIANELELHRISDRLWSIMACSAKTGDNLQEGMQWLIETIQNNSQG